VSGGERDRRGDGHSPRGSAHAPRDGGDHDHSRGAGRRDLALRVEALEALLVEKGFLESAQVDALVRHYEEDVGPLNGAKVVARAWVDPDYRRRLLADATAAIAELGFGGPQGEYMVVVENTPAVHNVVVCTLCSCYPWPVIGLPPAWYKSPAYRSRIVREPRAVLRELGLDLPAEVEIRVFDSSSEVRYLVLPERPPGSEGLSEQALAALVTRDAMIGVAKAMAPGEAPPGSARSAPSAEGGARGDAAHG
jgi:nitrile hydratase